jgi:pimeloyl-ACP methyl ester carboxylesterase
VDKQVDDFNCAISFVRSRGMDRIGLVGFSLGALVAIKAHSDKVDAMVLYAPISNATPNYGDNRFTAKQKEELAATGKITYLRDKGIRRVIMVDGQMIIDRETVNPNELLPKVGIPVLIIHGDSDTRVPLKDSQNAIKLLPAGSELSIINGDNHFDEAHYQAYIDKTVDWLNTHLIPNDIK